MFHKFGQSSPVRAKLDPIPLWRNRDYLLLWTGEIVSAFGSQISRLALPLLVLGLTGSPAWAGLLEGLSGLPFILLSLPIGALVDRWNRKRLMIVSELGRAIAIGAIPIAFALGHLTIPLISFLVVVEGTLSTVFVNARSVELVRVVEKRQLPAAISQEQATDSAASIVGPTLGGTLYALSTALPFVVDAMSFLGSALSLVFLGEPASKSLDEKRHETGLAGLWTEIRDGLLWLHGEPVVRFLAVLAGGLNLFSSGYALIFILLAQRLGASPVEIGLLFATTGAGSLVGALAVAPLQQRFAFGRIVIISSWVWAVTWPLYVLAPNVILLGVVNLLGLIVVPIFGGVQTSYRLTLIPHALLGRVNSAFRLVTVGVQPLSVVLTGVLLQSVGPVTTVWIIMIPQVALAVAATLNRPLREARLPVVSGR